MLQPRMSIDEEETLVPAEDLSKLFLYEQVDLYDPKPIATLEGWQRDIYKF